MDSKSSGQKSPEKLSKRRRQKRSSYSESEDSGVDESEGGHHVCGIYIPPPPVTPCSVGGSGPRLIITHIVIDNFKSYAGRHVLGPFHKRFTSIVGPNGSGKSNVIDAMLFVFGYKASKLRSKKLGILLHKSENFEEIQSTTVEVHFALIIDKERDEFDIVPNSAIYISRTAFVDNTSFYTINGKRSQFRDIAKLLKSHGIDLKHSRFLILQGEIEMIALMKPKSSNDNETGMLEYIEDIIGTSRYKRPLKEFDEKIEMLTQERTEKLNRLKLAEANQKELKKPMMEAIAYLKLENKSCLLKNKLFQRLLHDHNKDLTKVMKKEETLSAFLEETNNKIRDCNARLHEKERKIIETRKDLIKMKAKKEELIESFDLIERRNAQLREEIIQTNKKRKKTMEAKKQEENRFQSFQKIPDKNNKEIGELRVMEVKLKAKRETAETDLQIVLSSLREETQDLQDRKNELNNRLMGLNRNKQDARSKYELAKTDLSVYMNEENKAMDKLTKLKEISVDLVTKLNEKKRILGELDVRIPTIESTLNLKQVELNQAQEEEARTMQEFNHQRAIFQEKKNSFTASTSRNRVLEFIMKQKELGHLPGVFGRLGDLGGIEKKFDCAISTACGILDYIVVDTVSTAKNCVTALKTSRVGRGNFIALDQQQKYINKYQQPIQTPENVPRLFDLIHVDDERVKPAFYFGLQDTLVASELSQAKRVAYGPTRYRTVTLNGEIIEMSGTMSGGGREKRTGRMGRKATVRTSNVDQGPGIGDLEEKVNELKLRLTTLCQRIAQIEEEVTFLTSDVRKSKRELANARLEVKSLMQQEPILRIQVSNQEQIVAKTISDPELVRNKTRNVENLQKEYDGAAAEAGKLEGEVANVTNEINDLTGGRMKTAQLTVDKVSAQLDKVRAEITNLTVEIVSSTRKLNISQSRITTLSTQITAAESILLKAKDENEEAEKEAIKLNDLTTSIVEGILKNESNIDDFKNEVSQLNKNITSAKVSILKEEVKLAEIKKNIRISMFKYNDLRGKCESLKLQNIPHENETTIMELQTFSVEELLTFDVGGLKYAIVQLEEKIKSISPNLNTINEYKEKTEIVKRRTDEFDEVNARKNEARNGRNNIRKVRLKEFQAGFSTISERLKEMYQMITLGGDAEFEIIDSLDPFTEGIGLSVRPPKKSWKNISNLSGGEKTLSSLALVFALHYYKPSPLYMMDEIDAALDFKNVSIIGHYIKERTKNSQFIIISLRSNMFELADVLVGIYKIYNCTHTVTITPAQYVKELTNDNCSNINKEDNGTHEVPSHPDNILSPPRPKKRNHQKVPLRPDNILSSPQPKKRNSRKVPRTPDPGNDNNSISSGDSPILSTSHQVPRTRTNLKPSPNSKKHIFPNGSPEIQENKSSLSPRSTRKRRAPCRYSP